VTAITDALPGWFRRLGKGKDKKDTQSPPSERGVSVSATGGGSETKPVVVWEAANRMEAEIVKGHLESEGIPAIIMGEALGPIYGLTTGDLAKASVLVPAPLAERATEILESTVDEDATEDRESDQ
jgi:hypothetical protein